MNEIETVFVNRESGETIARSAIPLDRLPDTFLVDTTIEMGGQSWIVVHAEPPSKAEFSVSGRLTVTLAPVVAMAPDTLLFSLPTIANDIGAAASEAEPSDCFQIHEDDWRQAEFVAAELESAVAQELSDINEIRSKHSKGLGFERIHVRKRIPGPLANTRIGLDRIRELMPATRIYKGVGFSGRPGAVPRSFAWTAGSVTLWGVTDEQHNAVLLCVSLPPGELSRATAELLAKLADDHGLIFVDWVSMRTSPGLQ